MLRRVPSRRLFGYSAFPAAERERHLEKWTRNAALRTWIDTNVRLCEPDRIHLCSGSKKENEDLLAYQVRVGTMIKLNEKLRPNSYLARSDVGDVARVEETTFICSEQEIDAGPLNNWRDPEEMQEKLEKLFAGSMRGRTMYVVPFSMGPLGSSLAACGVQITDSPYVVTNMYIMARMGAKALEMIGEGSFVPALHSLGAPIVSATQQDSPWPCSPDNKIIVHFPEARRIASFGSGYGGNALLGKKCFALRIASVMGRDEGWLAEHMLILGITPPNGKKRYMAAAFPSACGKTNLAMMKPSLPGWKIECVGDDIAWMRFGDDGRLYAINPEAGFFGVAPGTSNSTNPNAMASIRENTIFTNVAMTPEDDVWWEGMTEETPSDLVSWLRRDFEPSTGVPAAHPNSRFTAPARQCPVIDADWEKPEGVPIDAIIFGGRRSSTMPLVFEARDWAHGTYVGATMMSETTAAAAGKRGVLRPDPMAMKPFCGYNIGDYFAHWLSMPSKHASAKMPKIFHVNWFRKSEGGKFLWPGFGDNSRVLEWIVKRCGATALDGATETPIGYVPTKSSLNLKGLNIDPAVVDELLRVDGAEWVEESRRHGDFLASLGPRVPAEMHSQVHKLADLAASSIKRA